MPDLRQSPQYAEYMRKIGWKTDELRIKNYELRIFIKKLPLLGNFVKIQRPLIFLTPQVIDKIAKKYRSFAVQINYSPTKTLQIGLLSPINRIFSQFKKDCRYEIRKAEENKITVKQSSNIESFIKIWQKNALRRGFWIPFGKEIKAIYEAFGKNAALLLAYRSPITDNRSPVSGALILFHDKTTYYFHAASTPEGRKLSAQYLVVWEAIKLAKKQGCRIFDFEGIEDPRDKNTRSWKGFTHFKKSFGGKEIEYPGSFRKYRLPF